MVLPSRAVQVLSACNEIGSPLKEVTHDLKFVRLMVITLYTTDEISAKRFPPQTRNMMERLFTIRVSGDENREANFNSLFCTALKEAILRNDRKVAKIGKVVLPGNIFDRK